MVAISEDGSTIEQDAIALEHPSPVSVLDASLYRDDEASPVKKITTILDASLKGKVSVIQNQVFHFYLNKSWFSTKNHLNFLLIQIPEIMAADLLKITSPNKPHKKSLIDSRFYLFHLILL